jgi:RNA polymerase sigma-70 factor (ECF subfamily)
MVKTKRRVPALVNIFFALTMAAMDLEGEIRSLREKRDLRGAATRAVEGYGPEVFGFLAAVLRDEQDASEVFSQTCEDLWRGLGRFEGRCTLRVWFYALARHAAARFRRAPHRRRGRHMALSEATDLAAQVRSRTQPHLRTSVKDRFVAIRDSLSEDDRALLILRVDRGMSWREIATSFSDGPRDADGELGRVEARLRKRFQHVKESIRIRARTAGLLRRKDHDERP